MKKKKKGRGGFREQTLSLVSTCLTPYSWLFALCLPASSVQINDIKLADCVPSQDVLKQAEKKGLCSPNPHPNPFHPPQLSSVCPELGLGGRKQLPLPWS